MDRVAHVQSFDVPIEHKVMTIRAMLENLFISEERLSVAENNKVYKEAYKIISKIKSGQKFPERIYELSKARLPIAKRNLSKITLELIAQFSN